MAALADRRRGTRGLAAILVAAIALVGLGACGADKPERDRGPKTPRTSTTATTKPSETPSVDPSASGSPTAPSPTVTTPKPPKPAAVKITIKGGQIKNAPERLQVSIGTPVKITIESDVADELHVHGVEQTIAVPAGEAVVLEFVVPVGIAPGRYAVELHTSGLLLTVLEVR